MENIKSFYVWIVVGVIAAAVVIYLIVTGGIKLPVVDEKPQGIQTPEGIVAVPGTSPVTEEDVVVTPQGAPVKNDAVPGTQEAPQQSEPIVDKSQVPASAVKLDVSAGGFSPSEFKVKAGRAVTLSVSSVDTQTHVFAFKDASLQAVAIGVGPGETRAITFNAPDVKGEYAFFCNVPGHEARGEAGKMIVE